MALPLGPAHTTRAKDTCPGTGGQQHVWTRKCKNHMQAEQTELERQEDYNVDFQVCRLKGLRGQLSHSWWCLEETVRTTPDPPPPRRNNSMRASSALSVDFCLLRSGTSVQHGQAGSKAESGQKMRWLLLQAKASFGEIMVLSEISTLDIC